MSGTEAGRSLEAFTINVDQQVLDDLRSRLRATRFAPDPENDDETYGLSTASTSGAPRCTSSTSAARGRPRSR